MTKETGSEYVKAVLELQEKITGTRKTISDLEAAIESKEKVLAAAQPADSGLLTLQKQREDLLAEITLGGGNQKELDRINKAIADEQAKMQKSAGSNGALIADTEQAVAGLKRKLESTESELAELEYARYHAVQCCLISEVERIGDEYLYAAEQLAQNHRRLLALDQLLGQHHRGATIKRINQEKLTIALYDLKSHKAAASSGFPGEFGEVSKTYRDPLVFSRAVEAERQRLKDLGVAL